MAQPEPRVDLNPFVHQVIILNVNGILQGVGVRHAAFVIGCIRAFSYERAGSKVMISAEHSSTDVVRGVGDKIKIVLGRAVLYAGSVPERVDIPIVLIA